MNIPTKYSLETKRPPDRPLHAYICVYLYGPCSELKTRKINDNFAPKIDTFLYAQLFITPNFQEWFCDKMPHRISDIINLLPELEEKYSQVKLMNKFELFNENS